MLRTEKQQFQNQNFSVDLTNNVKNAFSTLFNSLQKSNDIMNNNSNNNNNNEKHKYNIFFKQGQDCFHIIDFFSQNLKTISTPNLNIKSITPLLSNKGSNLNDHYTWILSGIDKNSSQLVQCIVSYSSTTNFAMISKLSYNPIKSLNNTFNNPLDLLNNESSLSNHGTIDKWVVLNNNSNNFINSKNLQYKFATWDGTTNLHLGQLFIRPLNDSKISGELKLWPRSHIIGKSKPNKSNHLINFGTHISELYTINHLQKLNEGSKKSIFSYLFDLLFS